MTVSRVPSFLVGVTGLARPFLSEPAGPAMFDVQLVGRVFAGRKWKKTTQLHVFLGAAHRRGIH